MSLTSESFARAAAALGCDVAAIRAVCEVEAPGGGFDATGQPRILFEGHLFSKATGGRFDASHPTISYPRWVRTFYATGPNADARNAGEHRRLQVAASLDRAAALQSASWGRFQILGSNWKGAGAASLQGFINAMYASEDAHLDAFVALIKSWGLAPTLRERRWADFATRYNGPAYAQNAYDTKLAAAYARALAAA
jgi:hypothetical protein